jgi:hypothetical protein
MGAPEDNKNAAKDPDEKADSFLHIRVRRTDKARWVRAAQRAGKKLFGLATVPGFRIGLQDLSDFRIGFAESHSFDPGFRHECGGILGPDLLHYHEALIDLGNRALYLKLDYRGHKR